MRVIAGSRKRLPLKTVPGQKTRPTQDRIKETLFNMIHDDICDADFLDLFAGSGQMGIEALSRGARKSVFIEKDRTALQCIKDNLSFTKLTDQSQVISGDALISLERLSGQESFDIIFIDPPYHLGIEEKVLAAIKKNGLLQEMGYIIVEADINTDFSFVKELGYDIIKEKHYKTNKHIFLELCQE